MGPTFLSLLRLRKVKRRRKRFSGGTTQYPCSNPSTVACTTHLTTCHVSMSDISMSHVSTRHVSGCHVSVSQVALGAREMGWV